MSGDLNADCDEAVSTQLLTITLMEELWCRGSRAGEIEMYQQKPGTDN